MTDDTLTGLACPDDATLSAWAAGTLPPELRVRLDPHVSNCASCRERVAASDQTFPALAGDEARARARPGTEADEEELARGRKVGRFVVLEQIGAGGMGVVYAAFDPLLERKVALKFLRLENIPSELLAESKARLVREAQAIARLTHPNVVTVYDAGTFERGVFVAMEFVEGETLHQWTWRTRRSWREIVQMYVGAAHGLGAAHAAGIVHRDFKPTNALVGKDARVRVVDFGLARATERPAEVNAGLFAADANQDISSSGVVTVQGVMMGTPAYMPPEQISGGVADARADQFSFCVSLYEALYKTRPFPGTTLAEVLLRIRRGDFEPPKRAMGPRSLRRVLARGLHADPEKRYPTMEALAADLARVVRGSRLRLWAPAMAAVVIAGVSGAVMARNSARQVCTGAAAEMASTWDAERQRRLLARWQEADAKASVEELRRPLALLDGYAQSWIAEHTNACVATRVRGEQPEDLLGLRMVCLERRRRDLDAVVRALESAAKGSDASRAVEAAASLPPLSSCDGPEVLARGNRLTPPATVRPEVEAIRDRQAELEALRFFEEEKTLTEARALVARAEATKYDAVAAEVLRLVGRLEADGRNFDASQAALTRAVIAADRAGHDEERLRAESELTRLFGYKQTRVEVANAHADRMFAVLERLGRPSQHELDAVLTLGLVRFRGTDYVQANQLFQRALTLSQRLYGEGHPRTALISSNLAQSYRGLGQFALAEQAARKALNQLEASAGPRHRWTGTARYSLATILMRSGRYDEAMEEFIATHPGGFDEQRVEKETVALHLRVAYAHLLADRLDRAGPMLEDMWAWVAKNAGPTDPIRSDLRNVYGEYLHARGDLVAALALFDAGIADLEKAGTLNTGVAFLPCMRAAMLRLELEDLPGAERAVACAEKATQVSMPAEHPDRIEVRSVAGELALAQKDYPRACSMLDDALAAQERLEPDTARIARTRFALLRCLEATGADEARRAQLQQQLTVELRKSSPILRHIREQRASRG